MTQGRGRQDRQHQHDQGLKTIFVYPLVENFRKIIELEQSVSSMIKPTSAPERSQFKQLWALMAPHLNERMKRLLAGAQSLVLGYGGIEQVIGETGLSRSTIDCRQERCAQCR